VTHLSHDRLSIVGAAERHISAEEMALVRTAGFKISGSRSDRIIDDEYIQRIRPLKRIQRSRIEEDAYLMTP
jgi:hypothetical protein